MNPQEKSHKPQECVARYFIFKCKTPLKSLGWITSHYWVHNCGEFEIWTAVLSNTYEIGFLSSSVALYLTCEQRLVLQIEFSFCNELLFVSFEEVQRLNSLIFMMARRSAQHREHLCPYFWPGLQFIWLRNINEEFCSYIQINSKSFIYIWGASIFSFIRVARQKGFVCSSGAWGWKCPIIFLAVQCFDALTYLRLEVVRVCPLGNTFDFIIEWR